MNLKVVWIFLGIIVVAAILYLIGYLIRRSNYTKLDALEKRRIALFELPVYDEVDEVKHMHLVGQSQNTFRSLNDRWTQLSTAQFAELESRIFEVENLNDSFRFMKVKAAIVEANETMNEMEQELTLIRTGLEELKVSEQRNSQEVQRALDVYEEVANTLRDNSAIFGPAYDELQKQVQNIEIAFTQFVSLNTAGDPIEARDVLEKAEQHTYEIDDLMKRIPSAFQELHQVFPEDIKDLRQGHDKMVTEKYQFISGNLTDDIKKIENRVQANLADLARCEIDAVESENLEIAKSIEKLYEVMEKEVTSKNYVTSHIKRLGEFIQHATKNNRQLSIELDHTSQNYTLNHNELGRSRGFQAQIDELSGDFNVLLPEVENHQKVYSEVEVFIKNGFQILEEIETQQVEIDKALQELRQGEKAAQETLDDLEFQLRGFKRYVEKQRLPGLSADYLEFFFVATDRLESLDKQLNKIRIDMDRINELVELCKEDIQLLKRKTEELVDAAALTEQMLQYANRYRHTHPMVKDAIEHALTLFNRDYRYKEALDEIGTALERVEPGAFKRIESFYFKNRENL